MTSAWIRSACTVALLSAASAAADSYPVVDTGQRATYDDRAAIAAPEPGAAFHGQDAQHDGAPPAYRDNGDGTVTDLVTGLMWQRDLPAAKYDYRDALVYADTATVGGYGDWRLPTVKELYSLILFSGRTGMDVDSSVPYLDTEVFDFRFGGTVVEGERFIDVQYATSTLYRGTTMNGNETMFGVNFVDGRIKGYPTFKLFEVKLVRGGEGYGVNDFVDHGDGTVTDAATGLMWERDGSDAGMDWQAALARAQAANEADHLGYDDWRLPNAKELHTLVDYERSPTATGSAAISPVFHVPTIVDETGDAGYPAYWTSTTHYDGPRPNKAVYVAFGQALGYFGGRWQDVHGAGAQRSDPKAGDPDDYPQGFGPQGDAIRIDNFVRLVRDAGDGDEVRTGVRVPSETQGTLPAAPVLHANHPNPFNPTTTLSFSLPDPSTVSLRVHDLAGQRITTLVDTWLPAGRHTATWDAAGHASGPYLCTLRTAGVQRSRVILLLR